MLYKILERSMEDVLIEIGKSAATGGVIDGGLAVVDKENVLKEVGCGVVTGATGAAARTLYEHYFNKGKVSTIVSISASVGARYIYRSKFPTKKMQEREEKEENKGIKRRKR